jgi:hypothetical protein
LVKPLYTVKQFLCVKGKGSPKKWEKKITSAAPEWNTTIGGTTTEAV